MVMQEYGVLFLKGLLKGLRPFRAGPLEDPMLYECWNLIPTETGLIGHDFLLEIGIPEISYEYIGIYDQSQVLWYWNISYDGTLYIWNRIPTDEIYKVINATPDITPWWWPLEDETGGIWYLYPNVITGQPILSDVQPTNGESDLEVGFHLRTIFFEFYEFKANSILPSFYSSLWIPSMGMPL